MNKTKNKSMKKHFIILSLLFLMLISGIASAQTVYVKENGKKYHKKNCSVVSEGKKGMELNEAKKKGYEPCNVCKPDQKEENNSKKTEAVEPKKKK